MLLANQSQRGFVVQMPTDLRASGMVNVHVTEFIKTKIEEIMCLRNRFFGGEEKREIFQSRSIEMPDGYLLGKWRETILITS